MNKLEIEQCLLDKQLQQADKQRNMEYINVDGQIVDKRSAHVVEAQMGIEYAEKKIEQQEMDIAKVRAQNVELKAQLNAEQEKEKKLKAIAEQKYSIDLSNIEAYLPKGKEFYAKVEALEKHRIQQARDERKEIRSNIRSKSVMMDVARRQMLSKADKLDLLKAKLR